MPKSSSGVHDVLLTTSAGRSFRRLGILGELRVDAREVDEGGISVNWVVDSERSEVLGRKSASDGDIKCPSRTKNYIKVSDTIEYNSHFYTLWTSRGRHL